jgi:tRNA pseudouridine13 synthase
MDMTVNNKNILETSEIHILSKLYGLIGFSRNLEYSGAREHFNTSTTLFNKMPDFNLSVPYITGDILGIGGRIRAKPEDFIVEEVSIFEPKGVGSHLFASITKKGVTTRKVQEKLAELFDIKYQEVGTAGLKDKESVATQTFSINLEGNKLDPEDAATLIEEHIGFTVNWVRYHNTKYRTGHIMGNRFRVLISDIQLRNSEILERVQSITNRINKFGIPNYYGKQRLGRGGKNVVAGWKILNGEKRIGNKWLRRYLISAYQSYLCNTYLSERVKRGKFKGLVHGDIVSSHDPENRYWVADLEVDQQRFLSKEVSFTAPMFGQHMISTEGEAAALEDELFQESGLTMEQLGRNNVTGARRLGRVVPEISFRHVDKGMELSFMLEKGGFATTVLREYMKYG